MAAITLNWRAFLGECSTRVKELRSSPGYWAYALISLIVGGVGVWAPQLFGISTETNARSFAFLTYGFAVTGGMLLDLMLKRDRDVEVSVVGALVVLVGVILLLNPFFRHGPFLRLTYVGTVLIVLIWVLANFDTYADKVRPDPDAAVGGDVEDGISGAGLNIDD